MQPIDPDDRLLAALRGGAVDLDGPDAEDLAAAQRVGALARSARAEDLGGGPEMGEPASFDAIATELGLDQHPAVDAVPDTPDNSTNVVPLASRRRLRWMAPLAAAAVVIAVVGVAISLRDASSGRSVATAALDPLADAGSATAELVELDDGFELHVELEGVQPGDGYLEVWLINGEITELLSLGPARDDGTYRLPDGLDPAAFPVVDVSIEHFDGDPTHSGDSVFRGQFEL